MDFIDFDTYDTGSNNDAAITSLPEPAPPLLLPINTNLTSKFKGLSLLRNSNADENAIKEDGQQTTVNNTTQTAEKYAKLSLKLFEEPVADTNLLSGLPASKSTLNDHFTTQNTARPDSILSTKLANVLNNYGTNESGLRDALSIIQQKSDLDLQGLIRSDMLGSIHRRSFRSDIESGLLKEHTAVLREFQPVVQKVESLGQKITKLNELNTAVNDNHAIDPTVLKKIEDLSTKKNLLVLKKSILQSFKKNFTLTQYEEHYLSNEDISIEYFQILHKCKTIHTNCSILLTLDNPVLGVKIMEKMSKFLDLSYQRISFFVSTQLELAMSDGTRYNSSKNPAQDLRLMKISFFYLANNLKYFDDITTKLVTSRSKTIVDDFMYQSNNADSFDNSRPIILSAHDPIRYIGDILAFVHSTIVNEIELISSLFQISQDSEEPEYERSEFEEHLIKMENLEDVNRSLKVTIERILGALSRPLKVRTEQIIRSEKRLDVLQKIFGLLDLYKVMFVKQLGKDSECSLLETLDSLKSLCTEKVFGVLKERLTIVEKMLATEEWALDDDSLLAPDWLREWLDESLLLFGDGSSSEEKPMALTDERFSDLCCLLIEKPSELYNKQAKTLKGDKVSSLIYRLNCLDLVTYKIVTISQLSETQEKVQTTIKELEETLTTEQFNLLLKDAGLDIHQQLIQLVFPLEQIQDDDDYFMYSSLIENKLFGKAKLLEIDTQLHEFLPTALVDIQQAVFKISSPSIANDVITGSSGKFLKLYEVFYKIVKMLYEDDPDTILNFTAYDVSTLLGVEDVYRRSPTITS